MERVTGDRREGSGARHGVGAARAAVLVIALATSGSASAIAGPDREHAAWTSLLRRHVSAGYVARYADEPTAEALRRGSVPVEFLDYDWSLNER